MAHFGVLRDYKFSDDVDDIRGATLYGRDDEKLGKIDDVIFDHATGTIQYAIVDAGGWLSSKKFLVPAERIRPSAKNKDDFASDMTKDQIEALPKYDEKAVENEKDWNNYSEGYKKSLDSGPVLHKEGSTHILTPDPSEMPATGAALADESAYEPERLAGTYPSTSPDPQKTRLRPAGIAAQAEDSSLPGVSTKLDIPTTVEEDALDREAPGTGGRIPPAGTAYPSDTARNQRLSDFESNLRRNRVDITASCRSCATSKDKVA